jgi:hypothetical protein
VQRNPKEKRPRANSTSQRHQGRSGRKWSLYAREPRSTAIAPLASRSHGPIFSSSGRTLVSPPGSRAVSSIPVSSDPLHRVTTAIRCQRATQILDKYQEDRQGVIASAKFALG